MNQYTLEQLAEMSGLTDRTLRTYLTDGLLTGEKRDGMWTFTPEDLGAFFTQPVIRRRMEAKSTGMVMDFLLQRRKDLPRACTVLDIPVDNAAEARLREQAVAYANAVEHDGFRYEFRNGMARMVFTGSPEDLHGLLGLLEK